MLYSGIPAAKIGFGNGVSRVSSCRLHLKDFCVNSLTEIRQDISLGQGRNVTITAYCNLVHLCAIDKRRHLESVCCTFLPCNSDIAVFIFPIYTTLFSQDRRNRVQIQVTLRLLRKEHLMGCTILGRIIWKTNNCYHNI